MHRHNTEVAVAFLYTLLPQKVPPVPAPIPLTHLLHGGDYKAHGAGIYLHYRPPHPGDKSGQPATRGRCVGNSDISCSFAKVSTLAAFLCYLVNSFFALRNTFIELVFPHGENIYLLKIQWPWKQCLMVTPFPFLRERILGPPISYAFIRLYTKPATRFSPYHPLNLFPKQENPCTN